MDEESCEVHSEDNKALPEKNKKRRLKTPFQVEALEKFYSVHKYPSEEMKLQLAESIELTEKQVSGWFCHRRLKDKKLIYVEASANGKQERSSGIVQDRGSGLRQDSCGSTKQGDNRHVDPREVESRRCSGQDLSAAGLAYEDGRRHNGNYSDVDDTSSESSLPLQHRFHPQNEVPFDIATSSCLQQNDNIAPLNSMGIRTRTGPSGYLKVKGQVENAAITAVKRQLGRHYWEDGPPLGVEFDPLPPGAFESSIREPDNEPYYLGDPNLLHSPDVPRTHNQLNSGTTYEVYNSKMSSHDSGLDGTSVKLMHGSDYDESCFGHQSKPKPLLPNHDNPFPSQNSSLGVDENSAQEMRVHDDGTRMYKMRSKHDVVGRRMDSLSSHNLRPYGRKIAGGQTEPWLCNTDEVSPVDSQREHLESKHSNIKRKHIESLGMEDRGLSGRMAKEDKLYGERRAINEYGNSLRVMGHPTKETRVAKRDPDEFPVPQQQHARKTLIAETPTWTNRIKRSAAEMPSSFSEDETAETSSSLD
ncbi:Homeobox-DDT domain protein RLT1 [Camellia lanceoleosa]|uniref:Homeobox-DDT domain protein RLT1 n=1 Tax=Camellia lanceoleosa TaxID=1840588 RepID=A0ACC0FQ41_9ERIC|nr:Homeobox-DDT domain protein RLT1 [Camellia lanceoleosa]